MPAFGITYLVLSHLQRRHHKHLNLTPRKLREKPASAPTPLAPCIK